MKLSALKMQQQPGKKPEIPHSIEFAPGKIAVRCERCNGTGYYSTTGQPANRPPCDRPACCNGFVGVVGTHATICRPGSIGKVAVLAARYAAGKRLWKRGDERGDGPDLPRGRASVATEDEYDFDDDFGPE